MSSMSTFGMFTVARLGILVSQQSLNTTGNNISNINTEGYTRQTVDQTSMYYGSADRYNSVYDVRGNGGVLATGIEQMRDKYLDIRYRNEMTRVGSMEDKLDGLEQLAVIFDEVNKGKDGEGVLEARFNDLNQQLETMLQDYNVGRNTNDSIVREAAEALAVQFNDYAKQLETLTNTMTAEFKEDIEGVNATLTKIRDLNESIRRAQVFGSGAMTQKDERNLLIDELSKKIGINVIYESEDLGDGVEVEKLRIETSGTPSRTLVNGIYSAQLSIAQQIDDVPRVDSEGNPVYDSTGQQIVDKKFADHENFDLIVSELTDARGKPDPAIRNKTENIYTAENVSRVYDKTKSTYSQADEWSAVKDSVEILTLSAEEVEDFEAELNAQFGYTKGTVPYFHVAQDEFYETDERGNIVMQEDGITPKLQKGYEHSYVVHFHDIPDAAIPADATVQERAALIAGRYSYANVTVANGTRLGDTELRGGLQATREMLTEEGEYTSADKPEKNNSSSENYDPLHYDPDAGTKRGIRYYRQALDTLARTFAEKMNEANTLPIENVYQRNADGSFEGIDGATYKKNEDGKYIRTINGVADTTNPLTEEEVTAYFKPNTDYGRYFDTTTYTLRVSDGKYYDEDNNELNFANAGLRASDFTGQSSIRLYTVKADHKEYFGGNLFSTSSTNNLDGTSGNAGDTEKITAANISISHAWTHGELHVLRSIDPDADKMSRASDNLAHIVTLFTEKHDFTYGTATEGTTYFRGTFQEMLTDTIAGTLAKDGNITTTMLRNYNATADTLYVDRDSVMGVDLNDEAMNMMQFQKAYSAACRLMTTYDGMLEKLINGTAV